ncbi:MAG: hypothetical protein EP332_11555 [Bacteroidetes bacterium]|nr:MAG: hypothetical protein EP332_11555 [Bacteroidota bacterium]
MATYILRRTQELPIGLTEAWDFFSSPLNLEKITPRYMQFKVLNGPIEKMYAGQLIAYTVKPVLGIPLNWLTEITHVEEGKFFVDEQRFGPYKLWHHQHHFEVKKDGVVMTDTVHYKLPFGVLGKLAHWLFVRKQLEGIFDYRFRTLEELFKLKTD